MKVVRKKLTADEFSPKNKRYVIDDDMVQTSPDGGVTWYDDPASDPRHNPLNLLPALSGPDAKCDAAENMMQRFKFQVDAFLSSASILAVVNVWLGFLLFIPGINILVALLFAIADALFTTGVLVIEAAMTEPVYDQIKCILYCNIGADGQMSAGQLAAVYSQVDAQIGGTAAEVFQLVTSAWGEVGFSNAGASGEFTGDCEECACSWARYFDFTIDEQGWTVYSGVGVYTAGVGFQSRDYGSESDLLITCPLGVTTSIARAVCCYTSEEDCGARMGYDDGALHPFSLVQFLNGETDPTLGAILPYTTTVDMDTVYFNESGDGGRTFTLRGLWIYGDYDPAPTAGSDIIPPEECL